MYTSSVDISHDNDHDRGELLKGLHKTHSNLETSYITNKRGNGSNFNGRRRSGNHNMHKIFMRRLFPIIIKFYDAHYWLTTGVIDFEGRIKFAGTLRAVPPELITQFPQYTFQFIRTHYASAKDDRFFPLRYPCWFTLDTWTILNLHPFPSLCSTVNI